MATIRTMARCSPTRSRWSARDAEVRRRAAGDSDTRRRPGSAFRAKWMPVRGKKMGHLCATEVAGYTDDDLAQPCMCRLVVKPSQPDHGSFNRFGRTWQSTEDKMVRPRLNHVFCDVQREQRYQVRCGKERCGGEKRSAHRRAAGAVGFHPVISGIGSGLRR